jgi:hypothetical protein
VPVILTAEAVDTYNISSYERIVFVTRAWELYSYSYVRIAVFV